MKLVYEIDEDPRFCTLKINLIYIFGIVGFALMKILPCNSK